MGHEAHHDDVLASGGGKARLQISAGKGVRQLFLDHRLSGPRSQCRDDRAALGIAVEQAAGFSLCAIWEDRRAAAAGLRQQFRRVGDRGLGAGDGDGAGEILVLDVDENETGVPHLGWG